MADTPAGADTGSPGAIPYFEDANGEIWDKLVLGPHALPGTWTVRGDVVRKIDVKSTKGQDGARFRDQGYKPAELTFVGRMVGPTDFAEMVKAGKLLSPRRRGVAMEPLQSEHPALTFLGVGNVLIKRVSAPKRGAGGVPEFTIGALEWVPKPKPKPAPADTPTPTTLGAVSTSDIRWRVAPSDSITSDDIQYRLARTDSLESQLAALFD